MLLCTTENIGHEYEVIGLVRGNCIQSKNIVRDFTQGLKNIVGGELGEYTKMMEEARTTATDRMVEHATKLNADALGPISGAHFNPAVTIGLWAGKKFPGKDVIPYVIAQFIGAIIASAALLAISGPKASTIGALGGVGPFGDISIIGMFIVEFLGTALLMYVIMATAVDKNAPSIDAALDIGLVLAGIVIALGNFTGCGINPARAFSPMLFNFFVSGANAFIYYPIYFIAPIVGAIVAVYLYDYFHKEIGY